MSDRVTHLLESIDGKLSKQNSLLSEVQNRVTRLETLYEAYERDRRSRDGEISSLQDTDKNVSERLTHLENKVAAQVPENLPSQMKKLHTDVAGVKVKTGLWGAMAGFVVSVIAAVAAWFKYSSGG